MTDVEQVRQVLSGINALAIRAYVAIEDGRLEDALKAVGEIQTEALRQRHFLKNERVDFFGEPVR